MKLRFIMNPVFHLLCFINFFLCVENLNINVYLKSVTNYIFLVLNEAKRVAPVS